jgi:hypothetical protein
MDGIHVVPEMVEFIAKIKTPEKDDWHHRFS